jgi:hypothetical protein
MIARATYAGLTSDVLGCVSHARRAAHVACAIRIPHRPKGRCPLRRFSMEVSDGEPRLLLKWTVKSRDTLLYTAALCLQVAFSCCVRAYRVSARNLLEKQTRRVARMIF